MEAAAAKEAAKREAQAAKEEAKPKWSRKDQAAIDDWMATYGLSQGAAEELVEAGIRNLKDLQKADVEDLWERLQGGDS